MFRSLPELVRHAVRVHASLPAVYQKQGDTTVTTSYAQFGEEVAAAARGLLGLGIAPGDRVVILSENCAEWVIADVAILALGAATVPIYPTLPDNQVAPLIQRVRAKVVLCDDLTQLAKLDKIRAELPTVERILLFHGDRLPEGHPLARPWQEVVAQGRAATDRQAEVEAREAAIGPDTLATIIFTSGTTGVPKGAMLTHGNLISNVLATMRRVDVRAGDRFVTFLPLSHVFMRMVCYLGMLAGAGSLYNESLRSLLPDLKVVRPTVLIVVPRFLELVRERVQQNLRSRQGLVRVIADWGVGVAERYSRAYTSERGPGGWLCLLHRLADARVCRRIRGQIGLGELRYMVSGGAALPPEVGRWFFALGLRVHQGYGLTETSPVIAVQDPSLPVRFETIGPPIEDVEVRLADDGELLARGPNIMQGYFEMPEETAAVLDGEGWFSTGDLAVWAHDGHLQITGRKKDIMVLANGKNVAPAPIEQCLQSSPLISQVLLIGDEQNVVTALIVPNFDALKVELAKAGEEAATPEAMAASRAAEKLIRAEISRVSGHLASFEMVRKFRLLPHEFSLERGEITPTLKLRRAQIIENYQALVRDMAE